MVQVYNGMCICSLAVLLKQFLSYIFGIDDYCSGLNILVGFYH